MRAYITPDPSYFEVPQSQQDILNNFDPINLSELLETVSHMNVSSSPLDIVPTK